MITPSSLASHSVAMFRFGFHGGGGGGFAFLLLIAIAVGGLVWLLTRSGRNSA